MRTNCTVSMGAEIGSMTPISAKVTLDKQTVVSQVTRGYNMAVGTAVFQAILLIMTIVKILVANNCG